jgi:hypothetical protein
MKHYNNSKEGQDIFADFLINDQRKKTFLDLGCNHPINSNNTIYLENKGWSGVISDIDANLENNFIESKRKCLFRTADLADPKQLNDLCDFYIEHFGNYVDFLSFDVDAATIKVLENFPFDKLSFGVMCFEHDTYWQNTANAKKTSMLSLLSNIPKYKCIVDGLGFHHKRPDGTLELRVHEDWWVNTDIFGENIMKYYSKNIFWEDYIDYIHSVKKKETNKYHIIRFGAGLGDVIRGLTNHNLYNNMVKFLENSDDKIIISLHSHNKFTKEIFTSAPVSNKFIIFDIGQKENIDTLCRLPLKERNDIIRNRELEFLKEHDIDLQKVIIDKKHMFQDNLPMIPRFTETDADRMIIKQVTDLHKPIVVLSTGAGHMSRSIPNTRFTEIVDSLKENYSIVQIGRNNINGNIREEPIVDNVINLVDKLSVTGVMRLIDVCSGMITCDSSMYHYAAAINANILVIVPTKNHALYGLIDVGTRHMGYFGAFGRDNVVATDFADFDQTHIDKFKNIIESSLQTPKTNY